MGFQWKQNFYAPYNLLSGLGFLAKKYDAIFLGQLLLKNDFTLMCLPAHGYSSIQKLLYVLKHRQNRRGIFYLNTQILNGSGFTKFTKEWELHFFQLLHGFSLKYA
eukprot:TRINITY_DN19325_c0_g1_i1.p2 TRINITY_DN19325_c0_g1~~TRINITY_DN19325_c0_g1_i1.p2  ORF type:complete len:106 (-),score=2.96 TRINITY_DN19325_c0_g1_i1:155-472(-)